MDNGTTTDKVETYSASTVHSLPNSIKGRLLPVMGELLTLPAGKGNSATINEGRLRFSCELVSIRTVKENCFHVRPDRKRDGNYKEEADDH